MPQINFLYLKSGLFKNEIEEMSVIFDIFIEFIGKKLIISMFFIVVFVGSRCNLFDVDIMSMIMASGKIFFN